MPNARTQQRFADALLRARLVDDLQLKSALAHVEQWGVRLPRALAELGFADEDEMVEILAKSIGCPVVHLGNVLRDNGAMRALGVEFCEEHSVFPVTLKDRVLTLAMPDPTDLKVMDEAGSRAKGRVVPVMAAESEIRSAIAKNFRGQEVPASRRGAMNKVRRSEASAEDFPAGSLTGALAFTPELTRQAPEFSDDEAHRLEMAFQNQAKVGAILRAVQELLVAKGLK